MEITNKNHHKFPVLVHDTHLKEGDNFITTWLLWEKLRRGDFWEIPYLLILNIFHKSLKTWESRNQRKANYHYGKRIISIKVLISEFITANESSQHNFHDTSQFGLKPYLTIFQGRKVLKTSLLVYKNLNLFFHN